MTATMTSVASDRAPERRGFHRDRDRPHVPHTIHLRELNMPDGRKITVDRRALAFICEANSDGSKAQTIVAFRSQVKGVPVTEAYEVLRDWWAGPGSRAN